MFLITMETASRRGKVWWDGSGWCDQQWHAKEFSRRHAAEVEIQISIKTAAIVVKVPRKTPLPETVPTVKNGRAPDVSPWHATGESPAVPAVEADTAGEAPLS